jgi:hypothetical protein
MTTSMQSHGGQVRRKAGFRQGCDDFVEAAAPTKFTRRALLRSAVFGQCDNASAQLWDPHRAHRTVITGHIADVSPHVLILQTADGEEERLALTPATVAWRGSPVPPATLHHGDVAIVRKSRVRRTAERIWVQISRATGTIIETDGSVLLVDEGPAKGRRIVLIDEGSHRQIQVRFPRLEPGYLIDVIGLRQQGYLQALMPATAQPPYRADHPPTPPMVSGHIPVPVSGTAVWHDPGEEPPDLVGLAYPALDPETNCEQGPAPAEKHAVDPHSAGPGCVRLPYLSVGSAVRVRNECSERSVVLPVTSCGASSRLFCDRCVQCGTSPRGRIADLTMTAFVELGGNLEKGCFNATLTFSESEAG